MTRRKLEKTRMRLHVRFYREKDKKREGRVKRWNVTGNSGTRTRVLSTSERNVASHGSFLQCQAEPTKKPRAEAREVPSAACGREEAELENRQGGRSCDW